nr:hypothetical protein [Escherichia coli]
WAATKLSVNLSWSIFMEHAKTCQRPISLERRLAATYLVAGLVTAGLAGCAAGPDFQRPTAPDVARYTATPVADRALLQS